ncbi:MAG: NUDIX domain-containing protein [Oscillospiraceae bacterium]
MEVRFYDSVGSIGENGADKLNFAVIIARSGGKFVFCKHRERSTLELPGGHREVGESIRDAAKRELQEETGAQRFTIRPVCVYSVTGSNSVNPEGGEVFGMLYFAEVFSFGELHSEIERIELLEDIPDDLTYPDIQPALLDEARRRGVF